MKHLNMTSLLARIALERDDELLQLTAAMSDGKKTSGNPMAIRFKPAVGDFIILMSGRLGISAAALVNIMIEGVMRETLTPHQAAVTRIPERFWLLMDEYNLSSPEVASACGLEHEPGCAGKPGKNARLHDPAPAGKIV
jgi:hypothetical protein